MAAVAALALAWGCGGGGGGGGDGGPDELDAIADVIDAGDPGADEGSADEAEARDEPRGPEIPPLREPGTRRPPTADCDDADPQRCLLPWPSDSFAVADESMSTGVHVSVAPERLGLHDDPAPLERADGFSRISPVVTAFPGEIAAESLGDGVEGSLRVLVSEPGEHFGEPAPLRFHLVFEAGSGGESTIVAYPRRPLRPASEHVAVALDSLALTDGSHPVAERSAAVALGVLPPETEAEAARFAYHAPSRQAMEAAGIDPGHVIRLWSFTSRSVENPLSDLDVVRAETVAAVEAGGVTAEIDEVTIAPNPDTALIALGRLGGLPLFLGTDGRLRRDEAGVPRSEGTTEAPFRVAVPAGEGDYRIVMYAHGTGGTVRDGAFDAIINGEGAAKVGIQFDDWTEEGIGRKAPSFASAIRGGDGVAGGFVASIAYGVGIQYALNGALGDALAADEIGGQVNPAAGRRPRTEGAVWAGGSLGGVAGALYASVEPTVGAAVLNVPGAGFTHFLRFSMLYPVLELVLHGNYPHSADVELAIAMAQTAMDPGDPASWIRAREPIPVVLVQQSIGDPVLPNLGSDLVAAAFRARHIAAVLHPVVDVEPAEEAVGVPGFTQFDTGATEALDIHGFAAKDTPAGNAAQAQIRTFIRGYWEGEPRIVVPELCADNEPAGSCDFSGAP